MMEVKRVDRRVQRTRQLLKEAFLALLLEQGYDATSIQDITDRANLGRATFYLHYRDKEELLIDSLESIVDQFIELIQQIPVEKWGLTDGAPIQEVFEYARQHTRLYQVLMTGQGGIKVSRRLYEIITAKTQAVLAAQCAEKNLTPTLPLDFISSYFAGSLLTQVFWWLERDMPYTAAEMAAMFRQISLYGRAAALGLTQAAG